MLRSHMFRSANPAAPRQVSALLAMAIEFLKDGRPADAIAPLSEAAQLEPSRSVIQHDLGLAFLEVGRVPEAIAALQRAVANDPGYTDAYFRLGIGLEKLGDTGAAIVAYDRATELQPSLTEAWYRAGALVYTLGHRDEAIGCFRRAAATGGNTSFGRLGKARALLTEDRNDEAELVLRKTLNRESGIARRNCRTTSISNRGEFRDSAAWTCAENREQLRDADCKRRFPGIRGGAPHSCSPARVILWIVIFRGMSACVSNPTRCCVDSGT